MGQETNSVSQLTAEILVVGNELLNGTTLDTNSHWLSKKLTKLGVLVLQKTVIQDDLTTISLAFKQCFGRKPDWVFSVGGLGPTFDDMTLRGLSLALGKKIARSNEAAKMLKEGYKRRAKLFKTKPRRLLKSSLKMAEIPEGSTPLQNSVGSAPGVLDKFSTNRKVVSLPGVPSEMKAIFLEQVLPILKKELRGHRQLEDWFRVTGISESRLSQRVLKVSKKYPQVYIKSHPMGFESGKSILNIQLIATTAIENVDETKKNLLSASQELQKSAIRLDAKVDHVKSVG